MIDWVQVTLPGVCFLKLHSTLLNWFQAMVPFPSTFPGLHLKVKTSPSASSTCSLFGTTNQVYHTISTITWILHKIKGCMCQSTSKHTTYLTTSTDTPTTCLSYVYRHHLCPKDISLLCTISVIKFRQGLLILHRVIPLFEPVKETQWQSHAREEAYPPLLWYWWGKGWVCHNHAVDAHLWEKIIFSHQ